MSKVELSIAKRCLTLQSTGHAPANLVIPVISNVEAVEKLPGPSLP
jgi:hypothetical protein